MEDKQTKESDINYDELSHNQKAFLVAYAQSGNITEAARISKLDRTNHYTWMQKSNEYKKAFECATEESMDLLETEARRRATQGVEEPVFYQGMQCGTVRKYSDTLLIFLLKGGRSEKYAARVKQDNINTNIDTGFDITALSRDERQKRIAELQEKLRKSTQEDLSTQNGG